MKKHILYIFAAAAALNAFQACQKPEEEIPERTEAKPEVSGALWQDEVKVDIRTDVLEENYYKDVIMDGGTSLTSRVRLPACEAYGISLEYWNAEPVKKDSLLQIEAFDGTEVDHNGFLLFPDGAPRFKVFYSCGGTSKDHGTWLGPLGRNAVRTFNHNGGSYQGSCAGAFLGSAKRNGSFMAQYYGVWPGNATSSGLSGSSTGMFIDEGSPLLKYFKFGGDNYVADVRHNGGCYCIDTYPGTEVLARYDKPGLAMHGNASIWSWKGSEYYGRVVLCGSHPEEVDGGERMELMGAMLMYSMEGRGIARVKTELRNGETFVADKDSDDDDPLHAKIGDGQGHNFVAGIPSRTGRLTVRLEYEGDYEIHLLAENGTFAFEDVADYKDVTAANRKELTIEDPQPGTWYFCVHNVSRPKVGNTGHGLCAYSGQTELLNGIKYSISVSWE